MRLNDLLPLFDREARLLTEENNHAASTLMLEAAERLRAMAGAMRKSGLEPDDCEKPS